MWLVGRPLHSADETLTIVVLRLALINRPGIVITSVPYQMVPEGDYCAVETD
jgi:hypothetical protein